MQDTKTHAEVLNKSVTVNATSFNTVITIMLSRLRDYNPAEYRLLSLSVHENFDDGLFYGEIILKDRNDDPKKKADQVPDESITV